MQLLNVQLLNTLRLSQLLKYSRSSLNIVANSSNDAIISKWLSATIYQVGANQAIALIAGQMWWNLLIVNFVRSVAKYLAI